jgi:glycine cleavage system H protein
MTDSRPLEVPDGLLYTPEHEWLRTDPDDARLGVIGITDFAQDQLGDVVYVQLPAAGAIIASGQRFGEIESVKTVSDLFAPVGGEVIEVNEALADHPELVNSSPYGEGWMIRIRLADAGELGRLLDAPGYRAQLPEG